MSTVIIIVRVIIYNRLHADNISLHAAITYMIIIIIIVQVGTEYPVAIFINSVAWLINLWC